MIELILFKYARVYLYLNNNKAPTASSCLSSHILQKKCADGMPPIIMTQDPNMASHLCCLQLHLTMANSFAMTCVEVAMEIST